jgi:hypothetical protein
MSALNLKYVSPGPVADRFLESLAFVCGIRGPIGSGKSTAALMKLLAICARQPVYKGRRHARIAVIRNSYPELHTTTIKTWHQWLPPGQIGSWRNQGPPCHLIVTDEFHIEVLFVALDSPDDVRKLLSMELTAAWINEAREIPLGILDGLTGRVGRYPSKAMGGCIYPQILMDTNPPDTDHWWYVLAENDRSTPRGCEVLDSISESEEKLREIGMLLPGQRLFEFFAQPSGVGSHAENLQNLDAAYYIRAMAGKRKEWIKVYVHGDYGFVLDGKPVHPEYQDGVHCRPFELDIRLGLYIGVDFGLTPAAAILQQTTRGQWRMRYEIVTERMGITGFSRHLSKFIAEHLPGYEIEKITGDPSGGAEIDDDTTNFSIMKANGIIAEPAHTNDPTIRRDALAIPMTRLIDGEPGFIVHPECLTTRKGLSGGFKYARIKVAGDERYHDKPDKNKYSHVCEAAEYGVIGGGEGRAVVRSQRQRRPRPRFAQM